MRKPEPQIRARQDRVTSDNDIGDAAVFFDFENILLGVKDKFEPGKVLEHLNSRGDVLIRRAYADWGRYSRHQTRLLELGVEMVFLPSYGIGDKNRTDTAVCIDAMEILFTRDTIDTFVIVSGDSDFGVLARRLRSYGKRVLGISAKSSASKILASVCHEFIFYESLAGQALSGYDKADGAALIKRGLSTMETNAVFQPSMLKDRMRKLDSTFSERNFGFHSFLRFIESYPRLLEIKKYDRGRVEVRATQDEPAGRPAPRVRKAAPARQKDNPQREKALDAIRTLLGKVIGDAEVTPRVLKGRLVEAVPAFDPQKLGYRSFTAFLREQSDIVTVVGNGRRLKVTRAA